MILGLRGAEGRKDRSLVSQWPFCLLDRFDARSDGEVIAHGINEVHQDLLHFFLPIA